MRSLWIEVASSTPNELKERLFEAAKDLCDAVIVDQSDVELAKSYGVPVASRGDGDIKILTEAESGLIEALMDEGKRLCVEVAVADRSDEDVIVEAVDRGADHILITCPDWKIIPVENVIAKVHGKALVFAKVGDLDEAKAALESLEIGVDGVVLTPLRVADVEAASRLVRGEKTRLEEMAESPKIGLASATIRSCKPLSLGLRACVDTCDLLVPGEGMLVGCQSSCLFLIQGEVEESHYVEPRPFRVNAGPVSLYVLTPENKTRYLSELRSGDEVLVVNREGRQRAAVVGRVKIEKRPLTLVEAEIEGTVVRTIVQNAETIRFVTTTGSKSVTDLAVGDEVLAYVQAGGRHFGIFVETEVVLER